MNLHKKKTFFIIFSTISLSRLSETNDYTRVTQ